MSKTANTDESFKFNVAVSTTLNKNAKEFGKAHMFDGKEETCWNSDQGEKQYIKLNFKNNPITFKKVSLISQGGFCPRVGTITVNGEMSHDFEM